LGRRGVGCRKMFKGGGWRERVVKGGSSAINLRVTVLLLPHPQLSVAERRRRGWARRRGASPGAAFGGAGGAVVVVAGVWKGRQWLEGEGWSQVVHVVWG
jgi:hypothetical protein